MFVREKRIGAYTYVYLVETVREGDRTKQRIIKNLGRKEAVAAAGDLDRLARSAARLARRSMILSLLEGGTVPELACRRIGAPLLFERLWSQTVAGPSWRRWLPGEVRIRRRAGGVSHRAAPADGLRLRSLL